MENKEIIEGIQSATATLRQTADEYHAESAKFGKATGETMAVLERVNGRIDSLETELHKTALVKPGESKDEKKSAQSAAFFKWMRGGKAALEPSERKALVENAAGLYLVPEEIEASIIQALPGINRFRQFAGVWTTSRDKLRWRSMTDVTMGWGKLELGASIGGLESTPGTATDYIYAEDLIGLTKIGEDELMDTDANLTAIIAQGFANSRAATEDTAFATGRGHTTYLEPAGIAVNTTLVATNKTDLAVADTITTDDMIKLEYALPAQYLPNASFLMHRKTEQAVRLFRPAVASGYYGNYMWQPSLQAGMPNTFDGFPVWNSASMNYPADTVDEATAVVFGDFKKGYMVVDRVGMTIQRLDELYAESGLVGFKAHFRVGGGVVIAGAFWCLNNEST